MEICEEARVRAGFMEQIGKYGAWVARCPFCRGKAIAIELGDGSYEFQTCTCGAGWEMEYEEDTKKVYIEFDNSDD